MAETVAEEKKACGGWCRVYSHIVVNPYSDTLDDAYSTGFTC